ncbi:tRNA uridine-5-carboxymethylaminomethyl(34) synthesis GTPase MnmE [Methylocystis heyeri]|uniref:tRNA modification GTPase MnmE n=1 Tax=Methylocystis heyeri TaxID=391905 RepID=A0A6B8KHJ0_9HYPH|nr:tRNA uridine-5-carboxymethylaminomethyl(34) synthesis GTPase MnmE [Methylocystis heyeri]QGM47079.1 tRNA uridine-5-carboxymethylaminomethyl(34) synthesis GTPase MnmE [Methylocystis heyeri]
MPADTIFALATGAGRSAVAVVRLSGPEAGSTLKELTGVALKARHAHYAYFRDPQTLEILDHGLALYFPAPGSATGEDCAELHLHGGRAIVEAVLSMLARFRGLRPAEPGEFARRAFLRGKMDLSQAEGLADLIDAQTAFQRRQALRVAEGALRERMELWRATLIGAQAMTAAELDFADESDVGVFSIDSLTGLIAPMLLQMEEALKAAPAAERLREGFLVLLLGPPNAGKSTLMNRLAQREVAIVSELPGTTRDMIEVQLDLEGLPVIVVDTAGLRDSGDEIERIGVARTRARAGQADLILWLSEGGRAPVPSLGGDAEVIRIGTKADIAETAPGVISISSVSGEGVEALCHAIAERAYKALGGGETALLIRERHRAAIESARSLLEGAMVRDKPLEIVAEDIRLASRQLERILGAVEVEQVLDAVFSRFCIGK